jgi:hypothetical protein
MTIDYGILAASARLELSIIGAMASKNSEHGFALDPRGKAVKIQGASVLPTRNPRRLPRSSELFQKRPAERSSCG